jgi:hypothetical protein
LIEDMPTMASESSMVLDGLAVGVDFLEGIVVFLLSAAHPYASWSAQGIELRSAVLADRLRTLYLAAEESIRPLDEEGSVAPTVTLESAKQLVLVGRVRTFGVATVFSREAPLGFARVATRQIVATLEQDLPYPQEPPPVVLTSARPTAPANEPQQPSLDFEEPAPDTTPPRSTIGDRVRTILSHLEAIAPDPHIVRLRVALRTGLGLEGLASADQLANESMLLIETAAEDILGLERGKLAEGPSR